MAQRGSYAKGVAKRTEILDTALDVVARNGFRGTSVKELADSVGLSQAGLLHYFDSKDELFTAILRRRDEVDNALAGVQRSAEQATALGLQVDALAGALRNASNRYRAGYTSYIEQLDAQRGLLTAELTLIQARTDRLTAYVALYQAFGGGWTRDDVAATTR